MHRNTGGKIMRQYPENWIPSKLPYMDEYGSLKHAKESQPGTPIGVQRGQCHIVFQAQLG